DAHLCRSVERLARSLGNKQLLAVALRESSRLVDSDAERAEVLVRLGDAELGAGNLDEAVVAYRDALDVHPGFAGAVAGLERLMELMANQSAETGGPPVEVLDSLERAYQDAGNKPGLARVARIRLLRAEGEERARQLEVLGRLIDEGGGRPHEALEVWGDLLLVDANNELGLTRLVELAENRSLLTDAVRRMAEAIDAAREAERPCFELCIATTKILLEKFGDAQTALRALRPALIENPDSLEALRLQGISARACGELELLHEALAKLATLIDNPEESAPLWREAAQVAEQQGNFQRVREDLEHVIELDESDEGAWHKWLEVLAGTEAWEDLADGLGRRAMITDKEEERHILRHHLARLLVDRLDRVEDAINTYHDMLAARPDDLDVMSEVETLLRRHERWDDVRDVLERKADCVHGDDRVAVLEELARVIADDIGEPTDAIEVYHRILAENPNHRASQQALRGLLSKEERWTELAEVLEARVATLSSMLASSPELVNDLRATVLELAELLADRLAEGERARALLEEVLEADPNDVAALLSLSRVQELAGEHEAMAETLQRAAAMNPTGLPGALLRVRLAKLAATPEEKREHLETALHMHPENLEAAQMLLELSREEGYWEQVAYLLALIGSFEADPAKRRELEIERADILVAKVGDLDEALDALAPIYDEVQDDPEINRRIADALFGSNRFEEARGMYSWLLEVLTNAKNKGKRRSDHHAHYLTRLARISLGLAPEDTEGPLEQLKQAYRLDTTNAETLITLADLHASREEWKETLKLARAMLLQNVDESGLVRRGDIYMRLAHAHVALDELHKAKSMLRRGRQEDPDHPEIEAALTELENA
ncbi:MAG: tetratricopeptide repeat protein, partial [Nannocystaceae bacterium]